jgi:predicted methyltransferase
MFETRKYLMGLSALVLFGAAACGDADTERAADEAVGDRADTEAMADGLASGSGSAMAEDDMAEDDMAEDEMSEDAMSEDAMEEPMDGMADEDGMDAADTEMSETSAMEGSGVQQAPEAMTLEAAAAGDWRGDNAERDQYRNPIETLTFFGLEPGMKVVEIWPGGGWYTEIIAPMVESTGGEYVAAVWEPGYASYSDAAIERFKTKLADNPEMYGTPDYTEFGPNAGPLVEPGTADMILTFRNMHNWLMRDFQDKAAQDFYDALRPGGILGVVAHRAREDEPQDMDARSGRVREDWAIDLFTGAGFELVEAADINDNPADTADHPYGVWTLKPVRRSPREGEEVPEGFDREALDAIGESDRFTLKFRKPEAAE